ncbi:MAG: hypothetical protein A2138_23735 [Deltaproteobacteria bacterium RBG_16_71_12]|nr:MAG: hypothetical protein A2138_23735 [Deltaproteobacteria bacterium RBG_16_71_12]
MRSVVLLLLLLASTSSLATPRVYLVPLRAPNVDRATTDLLAEQLLVSARRHQQQFEVVGAGDVKAILDVEAAKAAIGCDTESCANEIADALDADQLLAGQVGRIGDVWLLTLTRTDKATMQVLSRASIEAHAESPAALLPHIPELVDQALGVVRPVNVWAWTGGAAVGVGALSAASAGVLYWLSFTQFDAAYAALTAAQPDVSAAHQAEDASQALYTGALITGISGGALVVIGGATAAVALAIEE